MLKEILDKTAGRIGKELTNQPYVELHLRATLADTYGELGLYQEKEAMAQEGLRVAREHFGEKSVAAELMTRSIRDRRRTALFRSGGSRGR